MTNVEQALRTELESVRGALHEAQTRIRELESRLSEAHSRPVTPLPHPEHRYYRALDHLMEGCQIIGFDWRYLYLNDAAVRHGQQPRESLIGYTMMERYPGIETTGMFALLRRCMEERIPQRLESEFVYPDGSLGWFELSIQPVPEGIFILSLDITERKRMVAELRQNERRYRSVVEDQAELICRYDHNFNLTFVNQAYSTLYGKTPEAMIGTNILSLIVPEQREAAIAHVMALNADYPVAITEHRTLMPDGSTRWFQWQDRALLDSTGYVVEYQGVGRDITKQKLAEQELEALYNATSHLFQADSLDTLAHQIVETVVQEFEHADCGLMLVGEDDHTISRIARAGIYEVHPIGRLTLDGRGLVPLAIRTGHTVHVPDVTLDTHYLESDSRTRSELVVPLKTGRGVIGALDLQRTDVGAFSERDQRILTAYAERAAAAVENMQLYEQVNTHAANLEQRVQERTSELMAAKERVEAILNNSVDAIVLADTQFRIRQTNMAFNRLFACETDDYFGQQLATLATSTDVKFITTAIQVRQIEPGEKSIEFHARRKDGSVFAAEIMVGAFKSQGVVCTIRDITARKAAEAALKDSAEEIHDLYNNAPCGYHSLDSETVIRQINDTELYWFGYTREEVVDKRRFTDFLTPDSVQVVQNNFPVFMKQGWINDLELELIRKDGSIMSILLNSTAVYDENGQYLSSRSILFDNTARKRAESALRDSEEKFRQLVKAAPIAIVMTDSTGRVTLFNDQAETLFGYERGEMLAESVEVLLPEAIRQRHIRHREGYAAAPRTRQMGIGLELLARRKDGTEFPVEIQLGHIETRDGLMVMSFVADITQRKERERQLRYDASIQASIHDAVIVTDMDFVIRSWNPAAERIYGWSANEVIDRPVTDVLHTKFTSDASRETIQQQFLEQGHWTDEVTQYRKDGDVVHILSSTVLFKDESGKSFGVVAVNHDITQRKKTESALKAKMDAELAFQKDLKTLHDITIDLTLIDDLDEFYKCAVGFGTERLGFERLGLLLYDSEREMAVGTYGTGADGRLIAEPDLRLSPSDLTGILARAWDEDARFVVDQNVQLFSNLEPIGTGWNAVAVLWHGSERLGWLAADNGLHHRPLNESQLDLLFLYGLTLGTLLARKQAQAALNAKIDEEREFQAYLKALHEITIELSEIDLLDTFYQRAVALGLQHLGHERLAIFLYDSETDTAIGTFGTDAEGNIVDERSVQFIPVADGVMRRAFQRSERFAFRDSTQLYTASNPGGTGWNAAAVLWNGEETLGWLIADNGISEKSATQPQLDILALYALTLGSLLARKRVQSDLSMSESRYRLLADNATDLVMQANPAADFVYVSPSVRALLGYEPAELLGLHVLELVHPDDLTRAQRALARTLEPERPNVEVTLRFRHMDGHYVWLEVIGQAIHSEETGEPQGFIAAGRDITERKAAEDTLRRAFEKEKELGELKSRFVSMASHEFRTPLATILALTETIIAYRKRLTDEQLEERLGKIQEQIGHLKDIMEDVLQLARLQARRMEFNPVLIDLDSLCRSVMHEFESRPEVTQGLEYDCDLALHAVVLDKKLMRQIINNLLSNAVKYSEADSTVHITLKMIEDQLVLAVQDEGIGIPEADLRHLFTPFHRATNVGTISGTGLGLVIIKESVELHGGTIEVDSKVGVGTTFTIKIPITQYAHIEGVES